MYTRSYLSFPEPQVTERISLLFFGTFLLFLLLCLFFLSDLLTLALYNQLRRPSGSLSGRMPRKTFSGTQEDLLWNSRPSSFCRFLMHPGSHKHGFPEFFVFDKFSPLFMKNGSLCPRLDAPEVEFFEEVLGSPQLELKKLNSVK